MIFLPFFEFSENIQGSPLWIFCQCHCINFGKSIKTPIFEKTKGGVLGYFRGNCIFFWKTGKGPPCEYFQEILDSLFYDHKSVYTGEKSYHCYLCLNPFTHKNNLTAPKHEHSTEKFGLGNYATGLHNYPTLWS